MSEVVKKGYLDVKLSRILGTTYKRKFVVLINYPTRGLKAVDVMEDEFSADTAVTIEVSEYERIEVQERPTKNKAKYSFQVIIRDEVLIFSCDSDEERHHWIQSFGVLKQLAMCETTQPAPPPIPEYFPVVLVKNKYASDIGHSGDYFISIQNCSITLNWKTTRAIAYQWPRTTVAKFYLVPDKKGQLVLNSFGREGSTMEFVFTTEQESTAKEILGMWNICLLEMINTNAEKLTSSSPHSNASEGKNKPQRSISVRVSNHKAGAISRQYSTRSSVGHNHSPPTVTGSFHQSLSNGALPLPSLSSTTPPALPPPPEDSGSEDDDGGPDYARIEDKGDKSTSKTTPRRPGSPSLDDELRDLEQDIIKSNDSKKKSTLRRVGTDVGGTMGGRHQVPPPTFLTKEPDDYVEPIPSAKHSNGNGSNLPPNRYNVALLPQPPPVPPDPQKRDWTTSSLTMAPTPDSRMVAEHYADRGGGGGGCAAVKRRSYTPGEEVPTPSVPPRTWIRKDSTTSVTSSLPSSGSLGGLSSNRSSGVQEDLDSPTIATPAAASGGRSGPQDNILLPPQSTCFKKGTILEEDSRTSTPNPSGQTQTLDGFSHSDLDGDAFVPGPGVSGSTPTPPPLPPRSPVKADRTFFPVNSGSSHRCPRCNGRKVRVGKTTSLNDHTHPFSSSSSSSCHTHDRHQPCSSMPDLNNTAAADSPSHSGGVGPKDAPPLGDCSRCTHDKSCEQQSFVATTVTAATNSHQQDRSGLVGTFPDQQPKGGASGVPSLLPAPPLPMREGDMYVEVDARPHSPQLSSLPMASMPPEEQAVPPRPQPLAPVPLEMSPEDQRRQAQSDTLAALQMAQRVVASFGQQIRRPSAAEVGVVSTVVPQRTMIVVPSPSHSTSSTLGRAPNQPVPPPSVVPSPSHSASSTLGRTPNQPVPPPSVVHSTSSTLGRTPNQPAAPVPPPRSDISLNTNQNVARGSPPFMTRPTPRTQGSTVFYHHMNRGEQRNHTQAHLV